MDPQGVAHSRPGSRTARRANTPHKAEGMTDIRQELLNLIALNKAEKWLPEHIAYQQLFDRQGNRLLPDLIECLGDDDAEVRRLAVNLLDEAGLRAAPALPALIQAVADTDRLVRGAAAHCLAKFGPQAVDAVPLLFPWLQDEHEFVRLLAAVTIMKLDPTKSDELMPLVQAARGSNSPMVQGFAEEFMAEQTAISPYKTWIKTVRIEDIIGGSVPHQAEIDKMTYADIRERFGQQIVAAANAVGIDLTDAELNDIIFTLFPVEEWPPFHRSDYDRHC